jgi:ferredoxin
MTGDCSTIRLDKLIWYLRFAKSRSIAQKNLASGHVRINGVRAEKLHACVRIGDVITLPLGNSVRVIQLVKIPVRRGPAPEAAAHYAEIIAHRAMDRIDAALAAQ